MGRYRQGLAGFLLKGLIICVSFAAVFAVTYQLNSAYLREAADTITVVVAAVDLLPGVRLTPETLKTMEKSAFGLGEDYITETGPLFERGPWYIGDIGFGAGDVLRAGRLTPQAAFDDDWRWKFEREPARLIAVETSLARSSGDWIWPGSIVDAMVYIPGKDSYDEEPVPSMVISPAEDPNLGKLLVIDKKNAEGASLDERMEKDGFSRNLLPYVVTIMVDAGDTERIKALIRYNEEGKIYLSPTSARP